MTGVYRSSILLLYSEFDCYSSSALFHGLNIPLTILFVNTIFNSFLYFPLNILKPTINKRFAFDILQNCRVPDCAVSVVCQLIRYRVIFNAVKADRRLFAYCVGLTRFEEVVTLHVNLLHRSQKCIFLSARRRLSLFFV